MIPIRIREVGKITILDVEGAIDINASDLIETVGWLVKSGKVSILLNLEKVKFIDYGGLSILAISYKNVVNHDGIMKFLKVSVSTVELLKMVKLDEVFELHTDEEEAINSFGNEKMGGVLLRRKFKRFSVQLPVRYTHISDGKELEGKVINISCSGIYISSTQVFSPESILDLKIYFPHTVSLFEAQGKVVWIAEKRLQPRYYPGMGVEFVRLPFEKQKVITDFINNHIIRPDTST